MSAPDVATLYDFENQIEPVVKAALAAALSAASITCQVMVTQDVAVKDTPRVELELVMGGPNIQRTAIGQANPRQVPNALYFTFNATVVTTRVNDQSSPVHGKIRGITRFLLSPASKIFDGSALPYLQMLEILPAATAPQVQQDKEQDMTVLSYSGIFAIRNDAWPNVP
ncbi:MAG: hypothetical protein JSR30_00075 [Proteobacteria bacterium]|nr:hypothetical protein [Pseudomonadota bacterium]